MKDVIIIAGGDSERKLQLKDKLKSTRYNIAVCESPEVFKRIIDEGNVVSVFLLYPDELGLVDGLVNTGVMSSLNGVITTLLISSSPLENSFARSLGYRADEFLIEPIADAELLEIINAVPLSLPVDASNPDVLVIGDLALHRVSATVTLRSARLPLPPLQVRILEFLMLKSCPCVYEATDI